jgi:beta-lactamase regulating signal transducer with metallopeptidase domain
MATADENVSGEAVGATPSRDLASARSSASTGATPVEHQPAPLMRLGSAAAWLPLALLAAYAAGVLLSVLRLVYGWHLAARLVRRAVRGARLDVARHVYESPDVAVPITVGVLRSVIVVPTTWNTWDADTRLAVLAHEAAHLRRHDARILFVAAVNRAIFWFHPLAWWLERKLAAMAEYACDDAVAIQVAPRRYAEILLHIAEVARRNHGRLAWQAVGVNGSGLLDRRIDRLLQGEVFTTSSPAKTFGAAIACTLAMATVVACRQTMIAPLREDPQVAQEFARDAERTRRFEAARDMTQAEADALEQRLRANPQDFDAREQLVAYYRTSRTVGWETKVSGLRRHALWLIEHHPQHDLEAPAISPHFDPAGFAAAKKLWEAHLAAADVSPFLVYQAARFFSQHDMVFAEQLILRGMAMDAESAALKERMPPDVTGYEWPQQLAALYARALVPGPTTGAASPLSTRVRRTLEVTTDAALLARVGGLLAQMPRPAPDAAARQAFDEARASGTRYLQRALQLDPSLERAKAALVRVSLRQRATDADRLANRAFEEYMVAEDITEFAKKDMIAGKQQRDAAAARAQEVLTLTADRQDDPVFAAARMTAHQVLAAAALRDGDRDRALHHLAQSVKVPASEHIQYATPFAWDRPVKRLLMDGERDRVVEFLESLARLTIADRDRLLRDAQAIRDGRMPRTYQWMVTRERQLQASAR